MGKLFGTDGVRGVANTQLTPEMAFNLGRAAGAYFKNAKHHKSRFIIGKDTRISGDMLEAALAAGITSTGADVELIGIIPTPGIAFLCRELDVDAGVMISASHNPVADNGIKFFQSDGFKLTDEMEDQIEDIYFNRMADLQRPTGVEVGRVIHREDAVDLYERYLVSTADHSFAGLKIVVDCGFGASSAIAPAVLRKLGANVIPIHAEADGARINVQCGSTHVDKLSQAVIDQQADLGIAHDGDADRVIAVDENGQTVDGDQILTICGLELLKEGKLPNRKIAATVYSNLGLTAAFRKHDADVVITPNGDRYVLEALREQGLVLGGEQSGHIIFLEKNTTGDGILTALQLISIVAKSKQKLSVLASAMTRYPQVLKNVRVAKKEGWEQNGAIQEVIARSEAKLEGVGRILVRASGTEALIRVMAEGPEESELHVIVDEITEVIHRELA